ncbi:hypothetical protein ARMSODRAFT_973179 [Armillaria solidipes]|uniref:Uncharacterized protein n=1 Tax=Armillaria solidipes TaxID=1076256 RepID=A0A2H3C418_9AGAR|nr:hypothetical protein ARMSODRAFT_973179 [Armillaria solidipes]
MLHSSKEYPGPFSTDGKTLSLSSGDDRNTPFTSWKMAQIVVSVLRSLPTTLESKKERDWVVKHFQLREESTQDPDHIVLPTNGSVLCYCHEPGDEFVPVRRLDAIGKASYVAHNDAHDYSKKKSTFVIVGSTNPERIYPIMDFSRHCPTCRKTAKDNCPSPSIPKLTATVPAKFSRQQMRMLSVGRDGNDDDEEKEEEDADLYKWSKAVYHEPSVVPLSRRSSLDSVASDVVSETTVSDMSSNQDGCFDMAPPNILDEDDDVPASQAMLEIENSGYVRRYDDPPSDD